MPAVELPWDFNMNLITSRLDDWMRHDLTVKEAASERMRDWHEARKKEKESLDGEQPGGSERGRGSDEGGDESGDESGDMSGDESGDESADWGHQ